VEFYQTGYRTNDLLTSYIDLKSPSQLTRDQVALLAEKSSGKPESVETVEVTAGKPWERVFPLRQNDVYFIKLVPVVLK
jgi:xylan 1,4-beta-xylosidase